MEELGKTLYVGSLPTSFSSCQTAAGRRNKIFTPFRLNKAGNFPARNFLSLSPIIARYEKKPKNTPNLGIRETRSHFFSNMAERNCRLCKNSRIKKVAADVGIDVSIHVGIFFLLAYLERRGEEGRA